MAVAEIRIRRDTEANWLLANPVLASGEPTVAWKPDGTSYMRIGDGTRRWADLPDADGRDGVDGSNVLPTDVAIAQAIASRASETSKALASNYLSSTSREHDAPSVGLYFPEAHGAVGDGKTDDTEAIRLASEAASLAGGTVHFISKVYAVTTIAVKAGVKYLGNGATIRGLSSVPEGVFSTPMSSGVNGFEVRGFVIDCADVARRGVFARGENIIIADNTFKGLSSASSSKGAIRLYYSTKGSAVSGNRIQMGLDQPFGKYESLVGIYVTGRSSSIYAGLDVSNDAVAASEVCEDIEISGNTVDGGTHGISLVAAQFCRVGGNYLKNQSHRSIILSPQASYNKVSGNYCMSFGSAGIHIAYASSDNDIHGNTLFSDGSFMIGGSGGEGAIQVYVHCKNNRIYGNKIRASSVRYGIYSAIHCDGLLVEGNDVAGFLRAGIAVESDWQASLPADEVYGRPNYAPPPNPAWSSWDNGKGFRNFTVRDNRIRRDEIGVANAGIYLAQTLGAWLVGGAVSSNYIDSQNTNGADLYIVSRDVSKLQGVSVVDNTVAPVELLHVTLTPPTIKLQAYTGNAWQGRQFAVPVAQTEVDWTRSDYRTLSDASTIARFTGTVLEPTFSDRELTLRLFAGATLKAASIGLKGAVDVVADGPNQWIRFKVMGGGPVEISRNF